MGETKGIEPVKELKSWAAGRAGISVSAHPEGPSVYGWLGGQAGRLTELQPWSSHLRPPTVVFALAPYSCPRITDFYKVN